MSESQGGQDVGAGTYATAHVVRGGNREVEVRVTVESHDGRYSVECFGTLAVPAGDPIPWFPGGGVVYTTVKPPARVAVSTAPVFAIHSHTVCRDPEGNVKWEADTEPMTLARDEPTPEGLVAANLVVHATPQPQEEFARGH